MIMLGASVLRPKEVYVLRFTVNGFGSSAGQLRDGHGVHWGLPWLVAVQVREKRIVACFGFAPVGCRTQFTGCRFGSHSAVQCI